MDPEKPIKKRESTFLPHWEQEGATYAVAFRLADSLPAAAVERLARERRQLERELKAEGGLVEEGIQRLEELMSERVEAVLHDHVGSCVLREDRVASIIAGALGHFDNQRYRLDCWCIMPNHVHVVVRPLEGHGLAAILHSWKSYTAKQINKLLGREGTLWQSEYYDHMIRSDADWQQAVRYVIENPVAARLKNWKWVYVRD